MVPLRHSLWTILSLSATATLWQKCQWFLKNPMDRLFEIISFKSLHNSRCGCIPWGPRYAWGPSDTPLPNYTYQTTFYCASETIYILVRVHWSHEGIAHRDGEDRPVDHTFVNEDSPGQKDVSNKEWISQTFKNNIVVVLTALHVLYRLEMYAQSLSSWVLKRWVSKLMMYRLRKSLRSVLAWSSSAL